MTNHRPRYDNWAVKFVTAIFLLFIGGLINQFLNIPAQQAHQDEQILALHSEMNSTRKQVFDVNTPILKTLSEQHQIIMAEQVRQAAILKEMNERLDNHDRRSRSRR